jgi:hypothetical protein
MQDDSISVPPLDLSRVLPRYKHSRKRLILVDFEGTLWIRDLTRAGLVGMAKGDYEFPEEVANVLGKLADDSRNEVWLLSGLRVDGVLERFREKVPKVGIVYVLFLFFFVMTVLAIPSFFKKKNSAENGCFIKTRAVGSYNGEWINMVSNFNLTWKSACLEILNYVRWLTFFILVIYLNTYFFLKKYSSLRGLRDRSLKRDKLLWYGDSGWQVYLGILPIDNGRRDKLPKRKIISSIGMLLFFVLPCSYFFSIFIRCV